MRLLLNCLAHPPAALLQEDLLKACTPLAAQSTSEYSLLFGEFCLEANGPLTRNGKAIHLPPKELAALRLLLSLPGQIVSPEQLKKSLWGNVHVTDDSVPRCLSSLRARLEPDDCIQTIYKRGYRFSLSVRTRKAAPAPTAPRLAVMPFSEGPIVPAGLGLNLSEETLAGLAKRAPEAVTLLARDLVFSEAAGSANSVELGRALNADLVLAGRLTLLGARLRLRVEMIRVADGIQLWLEDLSTPLKQASTLSESLLQRLLCRLDAETQLSQMAARGIHLLL